MNVDRMRVACGVDDAPQLDRSGVSVTGSAHGALIRAMMIFLAAEHSSHRNEPIVTIS
jgi:hypothetical protein